MAFCSQIHLLATCHTFSFQLIDKLIVLRASVDGWEGNYILDTGIPNLLLNSTYFKGQKSNQMHYGISGFTSKMEISYPKVTFGPIQWKRIHAGIIPLTHLEKSMNIQLHGLLGCYLLRHYEVSIDYLRQTIHLCEIDRKGEREAAHFAPVTWATIPLSYKKNIPYMESFVDGNKLRLIIDTGAEINLMDSDHYESLRSMVEVGERLNLGGISKEIISSHICTLEGLLVSQILCEPMRTAFLDLGKMNEGLPGVAIDGIVGYEFLSQFLITLNFKKNELQLGPLYPTQQVATVEK